MTPGTDSSRTLLDAAYGRLGYADGMLLDASESPIGQTLPEWVNKGEWLALAKKAGAEKIFFVDNNPIIIFASQDDSDPTKWLGYFNRIWCMARPQLLFLARPGELSVYNLTKQPARSLEDAAREERLLEAVQQAAEVQSKLERYRRDQIESGRLFEDHRFGFDNRADHALIRDLKKVRVALLESGLSVEHAHALIGRSIFIRYLEDRGVLDQKHFKGLATGQNTWEQALDIVPPDAFLAPQDRPFYPRILSSKPFTYALFRWLAEQFNGDMFPIDTAEEQNVTAAHLSKLQRFLLGSADPSLFFFAYRFDIIPIELISSIYEEFYSVEQGHEHKKGAAQVSYYTPSSLVEFVLAHTLKPEVLERRPRIMDPACGSGIFLVEAFRRLVRHRISQEGRRLRPDELRKILREQIAGIDINPEAVRVAAFSLYLAMLHYQEPPDILFKKLPSLTYAPRQQTDVNLHFDILVASDAFHVDSVISDDRIRQRFSSGCCDVIVGNPPWGDPGQSNSYLASGKQGAIAWCRENQRAIGDNELSQAFVQKTLDLLTTGGRAGLLVSTGVFFKRHSTSRQFRQQWLEESALDLVVNFAAVRDTFFNGPSHEKGSIAPFVAVVFQKCRAKTHHRFPYWSAKSTAFIENVQAVVLNRADLRVVSQNKFLNDDDLWKVYWWGGHRDEALLQFLRLESPLTKIIDPEQSHPERFGRGYQPTGATKVDSGWLSNYAELPTRAFVRYGPLPRESFTRVPPKVFRRGVQDVYEGERLLIKRGITEREGTNGQIVARLESEPFCFRDSIHGVRLINGAEAEGRILLGILWSSLTRYYLFLTSGSWGMWHHEIKREAIERIPVRLPENKRMRERIIAIVDRLRSLQPPDHGLFGPKKDQQGSGENVKELEQELDNLVFQIYELAEEEKDLVLDMCHTGLDLFYRGIHSEALQPVEPLRYNIGRRSDIPLQRSAQVNLEGYLDAFLQIWEPELAKEGNQFRWRVILPDGASPMLAVVFSVENSDEPLPNPTDTDQEAWYAILDAMGRVSLQPFDAKRVYIDGATRIVTNTDIVLIKRNERRLWTRSAARYDAEASLNQILRRELASSPTR